MRPTALVLLAATLTGCGKGAGEPPDPEPYQPVSATAADLAAVRGTWAIERVEQAGAAIGPEAFREFEVTIRDQAVEIRMKGLGSFHALFALDAEQSPRHLDLAETNSDGKPQSRFLPGKPGDVAAAIYKLEGDTLVVATAPRSGEPRPTEFKPAPPAPGRSGVVVVYLKRK
jgi:uncharacterized protein (TIGR03067 family)